jgi:hypothetical protein
LQQYNGNARNASFDENVMDDTEATSTFIDMSGNDNFQTPLQYKEKDLNSSIVVISPDRVIDDLTPNIRYDLSVNLK